MKKRQVTSTKISAIKVYLLIAVISQLGITTVEILCKLSILPWSIFPWLFMFFLVVGSGGVFKITKGKIKKKIGHAVLYFFISVGMLVMTYGVFYLVGSNLEKMLSL